MGLKPQFSDKDVAAYMDAYLIKLQKAMIERLRFIGERFVVDARVSADFTDRTGNLRSSIGFIVAKDGKIIHSDFSGTAEGQKSAKLLAKSIVFESPNGLLLVVVAGEKYAASVESKGYDVITGSSYKAEAAFKAFKKDVAEMLKS